VSTRSAAQTRILGGRWPRCGPDGSEPDQAEEVALVAHAARGLLLSMHRAWLRRDDLEDCYSQATLELVAQARRGELRYSSRSHLHSLFELRFVSRVRDRRRALRGRSPAQALLDGALAHGADGRAVEVADPRADVERRTLLRHELRTLELAARGLSADQRLVLACQIALQMDAGEFCRTFGWSEEKRRKVAQRARARLRRLTDEPTGAVVARGMPGDVEPAGDRAGRGAEQRISEDECPAPEGRSGEEVGTLL
jgi:DNA-directed RNA polymerase specialized sigma24 family protein